MNVLFLSLAPIASLEDRGIYPDLLRIFVKNGHFVRIISVQPDRATYDDRREGYAVLHVQTPQMQKVGLLKKGIASLQIGPNIRRALDRHCRNERYDLILMATPPITLVGVVAYIKKRDGAKFYLLLKDIWPQGIADLGAISQSGPVYRYFRAKEKKLYALADQIGCMSPANVKYVLRHNPALEPQQVEVCPNSEEPDFWTVSPEEASAIRAKYGIPQGRKIFLYGGDLGRPQDIPFVIERRFTFRTLFSLSAVAERSMESSGLSWKPRSIPISSYYPACPGQTMISWSDPAMWDCCFWTTGLPFPISPPGCSPISRRVCR